MGFPFINQPFWDTQFMEITIMLSLVQGLLTARGARMLGAQLWQWPVVFFWRGH